MRKTLPLLLCLFAGWAPLNLWGQKDRAQELAGVSAMEREITRVEVLLSSFKNDSARIIAIKIIGDLKEQNLLNTPLGVRVQLAEGKALEQDQQDELALQKLLHVKDRCRETNQWDLLAKTCLVLALLYEKIGRGDPSIAQLRQTQSLIITHALDSIYPKYAVRIASWHRIYGDKDSSLFYAKEALRTAPKFQLYLEEATAHMLAGMLLSNSSPESALEHAFAGLRLHQKLEDYMGTTYMYTGITNHYYHNKNYLLALAYNDSMIASANMAILMGHERHPTIASAYRFRGAIFRKLNQPDSAWVYQKQGYDMELNYVRESTAAKVVEIDARYNDEKKVQQIEEQTLALQLKNNQLRYSAIVAFLILLLAAGLSISFYKQRQDKKILAEQNTLIREQSEELKTLDAAKSRFFANVSHELRTPITLMLGPVSTLLKEAQLNEKQNRLLQMAHRSGKELQELVSEILDLQKLEMGKMELYLQPTGLVAFFRNNFAQFDSLAQRKQIDFSFNIEVPKELAAGIDQAKCRQIMNNLLSNAFKFTPEGGRINAGLSYNDGILQFVVSDSGPGIHPDDLPHVFNRFFQTSRPDKPAEGGTGIGLALCREYARLFGGDVEVESRLGEGTVFRVAFPVKMVDAAPPVEVEHYTEKVFVPNPGVVKNGSPLLLSDETKPTILVVEDNPELQDYIRLLLSEKYHVLTADNGQVAMDWLKVDGSRPPTVHRQPSLILSDLMMPVMDGYQLLERLKSDDATRHIPVIMLTARAEAKDKLKALRIGVDDYLLKPFDEEELLARIENLLKNQAARRMMPPIEPELAPNEPIQSQADHEWLAAFEGYVRQNSTSDTLSIPLLAEEFAMSSSTLLRQLKRLTGLSPAQYLQEFRLNKARQLLENRTYNSTSRVAAEAGYTDARSFSRSFRKRFGKLPSELLGE
ncbi:MAG: ATP-binding protein [Saprospiraceae bacterium]